jgi:hypothetical protein
MIRPHAHHFVVSLPPEGGHASLGAAQREKFRPHAHHFVVSLPPEGGLASLGAAQREA